MHLPEHPRFVSIPICPPSLKYRLLSTQLRLIRGSGGEFAGMLWYHVPSSDQIRPGISIHCFLLSILSASCASANSPSPFIPASALSNPSTCSGIIENPTPPSTITASVCFRTVFTIFANSPRNDCLVAYAQSSVFLSVMPTRPKLFLSKNPAISELGSSAQQRSRTST